MSLPRPAIGLVICYAYLWVGEHEKGAEEGLKGRPAAIVAARRERTLERRLLKGCGVLSRILPIRFRQLPDFTFGIIRADKLGGLGA